MDFIALEASLNKAGKREYDGMIKFAVGTKLPVDEFKSLFIKTAAFDLWTLDPNVQSGGDSYWKLSDDNKFFICMYESDSPETHDRRWSVYSDDNNKRISIAYKNDTIATMDSSYFPDGVDPITIKSSLLKILSSKEGQVAFLDTLNETERNLIIKKYPELL
jgi:hypothetical protein